MEPLLIATGNAHKADEVRAVLRPLCGAGARLLDLRELEEIPPEPVEDGATFAANAAIKARAYAAATGLVSLADDSGLVVDALGGEPGVLSARYAAPAAGWPAESPREERDAANNAKLLRALRGVSAEQRGARFVCSIAVADPGGALLATAEGVFEGRIGEPPRVPAGVNGFGYDPLFLVAPGFERTSAELPREEKNAISHRGRALAALASSEGFRSVAQ